MGRRESAHAAGIEALRASPVADAAAAWEPAAPPAHVLPRMGLEPPPRRMATWRGHVRAGAPLTLNGVGRSSSSKSGQGRLQWPWRHLRWLGRVVPGWVLLILPDKFLPGLQALRAATGRSRGSHTPSPASAAVCPTPRSAFMMWAPRRPAWTSSRTVSTS